MKQLYTYPYFAFLSIILTFCACSDKKDNRTTDFPKPPEEKLDSVGTWLSQDSNYLTSLYLPFFQTHFNQQLAAQNIDSAARLLAIAGETAFENDKFDTSLIRTHTDFLAKYETRLSNRSRGTLYNNLGYFYTDSEKLIDADYKKAMSFYKKNDFIPNDYYSAKIKADANVGIMYCFSKESKYDSAIIYGVAALDFYEKYKEWGQQGDIYTGIALCYSNFEDDIMALKYLDLSLEFSRTDKDSSGIYQSIANKVVHCYYSGRTLFASNVDSLEQFENQWKPKDPQYRFLLQSFKVLKLLDEKKIQEAGKILDTLQPLYPLIENDYFSEWYPEALSHYEIAIKKPLSMERYFLAQIEQLKGTKEFGTMAANYYILSKGAVLKKDYKAALTYEQKSVQMQDSVRNNKIQYQTRELEKKYQTEKKEAQLQLQAEEAFRKNLFIAVLLAGFAALFYFYYTLKKQKNIIAQQNELNEQTITILSHDIKEPLLGVKLMLKKLNTNDPFVAQASQSLEGQINSVNGILTNLLKMKKLSLVKKDKNAQADVQAVVKNVLQELNVAIQTKELSIENDITEGVKLPIAPEKLQIIVHNLLSNAVKYSFPNQKIRIFNEGKGFCIQDFGVGLSPEQRSKLMREVTASQRGTNQEKGNGLGLFLVGAMLQGEAIKVVFDSPEVGGTVVKVFG